MKLCTVLFLLWNSSYADNRTLNFYWLCRS